MNVWQLGGNAVSTTKLVGLGILDNFSKLIYVGASVFSSVNYKSS